MESVIERAVVEETEGPIRLIRLNRRKVINAANDAIRQGLKAAITAAEADDTIRAIVICGNGERGFCAGADIKEQRSAETSVETRQRLEKSSWIECVAEARKPVIAAIHGICFGAGTELALACDIRIAASNAIFSLPETALGLIPGAGGTQRLPRLIGEGRAMQMILTGERIGARDGLSIGLVTAVVDSDDELLAVSLAIATRIANRPSAATQYAKEAVRASMQISLADGLRLERTLFALLTATADRFEAAQAFAEKRKPRFVGH